MGCNICGFGPGEFCEFCPDSVRPMISNRVLCLLKVAAAEMTADNVPLAELKDKPLYCPRCKREVERYEDQAYCWTCPNPDEVPLPLKAKECLSKPGG